MFIIRTVRLLELFCCLSHLVCQLTFINMFCLVLTNYNSRYLRKIFLYINHNHMEYFYKPWSITQISKDWGMQTHKKRLGRVAVPEKFCCINFVYLHRLPHMYMNGISLE